MTRSDNELMHFCREGRADAFEALVHRWERPVGRAALDRPRNVMARAQRAIRGPLSPGTSSG